MLILTKQHNLFWFKIEQIIVITKKIEKKKKIKKGRGSLDSDESGHSQHPPTFTLAHSSLVPRLSAPTPETLTLSRRARERERSVASKPDGSGDGGGCPKQDLKLKTLAGFDVTSPNP